MASCTRPSPCALPSGTQHLRSSRSPFSSSSCAALEAAPMARGSRSRPLRQQARAQAGGKPAPFPRDYNQAIEQAQQAVTQALADGKKLLEVEFPTASLAAVAGDAEGANEQTYSMQFLRQFLRAFQQSAATTRVFFPDEAEMRVAQQGKSIDPNAGSWTIDAVFEQAPFPLSYLTRPNPLLDIGLNIGKVDPAEQVKDADKLLIIAYPHFNVQEMLAVEELYQKACKGSGLPIVVFNAELDRIRTGYYPALLFPKVAALGKTFLPGFETAYYIRNIKGARGGTIFRCYPGPFCIYRRSGDGMVLLETREAMPDIRQVALEVLPRAAAAAAAAQR